MTPAPTPIPIDATNAAAVALVAAELAAPFDPRVVKFKPQMVRNNKALAIAYVDPRAVMDRLDAAVGVAGWQDEYRHLPSGSALCTLRLFIGGQWIAKCDVGSPSEQPDEGDREKAAVSDALKRAAVKFGVGRYLYRLPSQWVDYDPAKKQIVRPPQLPASALPKGYAPPPAEPSPARASGPAAAPAPAGKPALPADGRELHRRINDYDAKLAGQKACQRGALLAHVTQAGVKAGYAPDLTAWAGPAIAFAVDAVKGFEATLKHPAGK